MRHGGNTRERNDGTPRVRKRSSRQEERERKRKSVCVRARARIDVWVGSCKSVATRCRQKPMDSAGRVSAECNEGWFEQRLGTNGENEVIPGVAVKNESERKGVARGRVARCIRERAPKSLTCG